MEPSISLFSTLVVAIRKTSGCYRSEFGRKIKQLGRKKKTAVGCVFYMGWARETGRGPYYDLVTGSQKINYLGYSERVDSVNLLSLRKL
jgi:hypothetical protein